MKDNRTLLQGNHWQININLRCSVPGYLFVTSIDGQSDQFSALEPKAFTELGQFLGLACTAVEDTLKPDRVLFNASQIADTLQTYLEENRSRYSS